MANVAQILRAMCWVPILLAIGTRAAEADSFAGKTGTLGSDLAFLAAHHQGPEAPGESNHFIDLWAGRPTRSIALLHGLTNNNTLFINSHGDGLQSTQGVRYVYHPHAALLRKGQPVPHFSAADFAQVLGSKNAARIHNIVTAGCDEKSAFSAAELRRYFTNATNVVRVTTGEPGFQPMFFQAIVNHSMDNQPIYESAMPAGTRTGYRMTSSPSPGARKLTPFIAELFRPGEAQAYRVQIAGRELLDPSFTPPRPTLLAALPPLQEQGPAHATPSALSSASQGAR